MAYYSPRRLMQGISDGVVEDIKVDDGNLSVIRKSHYEIHEGNHYFVVGYGTYAADEDIDFQLTAPATGEIHMTFGLKSDGEATITIYEDADVSSDGSSVTAQNNDRNSSNTTSLTLLQSDGTVNTAGTIIYQESFGSGSNPSKAQIGIARRAREIILKKDSTYRFFIESNAASNLISWAGEWYEES